MHALTAWRRPALTVAAAVLVLVCIAGAAIAVLSVPVHGTSMQPTLQPSERVVVDPFSGSVATRFELVVTRFDAGGPEVIKRVIGLPGDRVSIRKVGTAPGVVRVQPNGTGPWQVVDNPAWAGQWARFGENCCTAEGKKSSTATEQTVPPGMLFLLGDHLGQSEDSRAEGWTPVSLVRGRVTWRVYPLGAIGKIDGPVMLRPAP
ncbi:signal peptidase I [Antrihabitans cavernicola]|uniref:signal peptidase I n=1 Tax=Antrihabitans cavernicola TaxID=2495913 RepID=UPI00165A0AFB|nr:signal peptidase I [Spelaeibacter cavernicola]